MSAGKFFAVRKVDDYDWKEVTSSYGRQHFEQTYRVTWENPHSRPSRIDAMDITSDVLNEYWNRVDEYLKDVAEKQRNGEKFEETEEGLGYIVSNERLLLLIAKNIPSILVPPYQGYHGLLAKKFDDIIKVKFQRNFIETEKPAKKSKKDDKTKKSENGNNTQQDLFDEEGAEENENLAKKENEICA